MENVRAVLSRVLVVIALACGLLALFGVDALGLGPVKLASLGVVLLAVAILV